MRDFKLIREVQIVCLPKNKIKEDFKNCFYKVDIKAMNTLLKVNGCDLDELSIGDNYNSPYYDEYPYELDIEILNDMNLENGLYNIGELVEKPNINFWVCMDSKDFKHYVMIVSKENKNLIDDLDEDNVRICSECGDEMTEGYCIENGLEYYCSDECLEKNMTREQYLNLYDNGNGDSYWTEWE